MDYSFLIGLHFRDDSSVDDGKSLTNELCSGYFLVVLCFSSFELIDWIREVISFWNLWV